MRVLKTAILHSPIAITYLTYVRLQLINLAGVDDWKSVSNLADLTHNAARQRSPVALRSVHSLGTSYFWSPTFTRLASSSGDCLGLLHSRRYLELRIASRLAGPTDARSLFALGPAPAATTARRDMDHPQHAQISYIAVRSEYRTTLRGP